MLDLGAGRERDLCCAPKPVGRLPMTLRRVSPQGGGQKDAQHQAKLEGTNDARTGMPFGIPKGAMCVQRFDDSLNSAIHTTYRISLRSSSMPEPRDPLLKVVIITLLLTLIAITKRFMGWSLWWASPPRKQEVRKRHGWNNSARLATPRGASPPSYLCNDPSAGSPTETLLRLLLPLNDRV